MIDVLDNEDPLSSSVVPDQVPSLEELVDACCAILINDDSSCIESKLNSFKFHDPFTPQNFKKFIVKSHCEENLQFLVEIYRYEYIWNQLFKRRSSILKCKKMETSSSSRSNLQRTGTNQHYCPEKSRTSSIINKIDLSDTSDISSFVNVKQSTKLPNPASSWSETWTKNDETADENHFINSGNANHSHNEKCLCSELKSDVDPQIRLDLINQWNLIIKNYICNESPHQINLPSKIYHDILVTSQDEQVLYHSPEILLDLKNFVLQLLRGNIYEEFVEYFDSRSRHSAANIIPILQIVSHEDIKKTATRGPCNVRVTELSLIGLQKTKSSDSSKRHWMRKFLKH